MQWWHSCKACMPPAASEAAGAPTESVMLPQLLPHQVLDCEPGSAGSPCLSALLRGYVQAHPACSHDALCLRVSLST